MYQVSYKTTSKIGGSKNECLLEWDEEISIYGRDFPTLQRRIKKNVLQIWKIFSRFDIIIYTVEERAMFELYIHFVFVMSCVMCWFGCVVLLVCGLDIGQERSTWWNQIADPTYWFRRNEEIRAVRDPPDSRVVTLTMPTLTDPIVKMVLEIGCWIPLDLQETWYIMESGGVENQRKKTIDFKVCKHYTIWISWRKIWTKLVCCLFVVVLFLSWLVHFLQIFNLIYHNVACCWTHRLLVLGGWSYTRFFL